LIKLPESCADFLVGYLFRFGGYTHEVSSIEVHVCDYFPDNYCFSACCP
jgi:hypothetical protein